MRPGSARSCPTATRPVPDARTFRPASRKQTCQPGSASSEMGCLPPVRFRRHVVDSEHSQWLSAPGNWLKNMPLSCTVANYHCYESMVVDIFGDMATCTAPVYGHRSSSAAAACPACRGGSRRYGGYSGGYSSPYSSPSYSFASGSSGGGRSSGSVSSRVKASWSKAGSTVLYTPVEVKALTPIRETAEKRAELPDLRDIFLCHAWADRLDDATELYDLLKERGVSVWFSEKDIPLGSSFLREIDKGLAKSRVGLVLVTPALLLRLPTGGIADRELSSLLATDQLVPIIHNTTYDALRNVSPLLASRNGLSTAEDTLAVVADKLADLVAT